MHIIRQAPNGEWFVYSTVTEEIVLYQASREDVVEWKLEQYREEVEDTLDVIEEHGCTPPETNLTRSAEDCIESSSLSVSESGQLVE